jgi:hypothetical protein
MGKRGKNEEVAEGDGIDIMVTKELTKPEIVAIAIIMEEFGNQIIKLLAV